MIYRTHELPVVRQCQLLALACSTAYYQPTPVSAEDLALMRRIDELHLDCPFAGARMLRDLLRREGYTMGRKRVRTVMTRLGIDALYRNPTTSQRHPAHAVYPYRLRNLAISLLRLECVRSIAAALRRHAAHPAEALALVGITF